MNKLNPTLNPIITALEGIDEKTAAAAAHGKRKMKKPLKIVIIAAAVFAALGTTAAAATLGEHPLVKLNDVEITPKYSSYVDANGWAIKTTAIEYPVDSAGYKPVGEVRAVYDPDAEAPYEEHYYDELGIELDDISNLSLSVDGEKEGEIGFTFMSGIGFDNYHQSMTRNADGIEVSIECWQDPIQAARDALDKSKLERMTIDEKIDYYLTWGWDIGYPEYGGFEHPSMRDIIANCALGTYGGGDVINYSGAPSAVAGEFYGYTLDQPAGFIEKDGMQVIMYFNVEEKLINQEMFIYTLTDSESGKDVKFTVWRSAENKDVCTDHFDFDYEYIPLNNGTDARLHQTADYQYVLEFEKDGAAYSLVFDLDREFVGRVLELMGV